MNSSNKKLLQRIEHKAGIESKPLGAVVIYNPDYPDFERSLINIPRIIALPDNRMDKERTQKIGKKFIIA